MTIENMSDDELLRELHRERLADLRDALDRAEAGNGTPEDWAIIRWECRMPKPKGAK